MIDWKRKLTSRKFWVALVGMGIGVAVTLGVNADTAKEIGGMVLVAASLVAYVIGEAWTDAAHMPDAELDAIVDNGASE